MKKYICLIAALLFLGASLAAQDLKDRSMDASNYPTDVQFLELEGGYNIAYAEEGNGDQCLLMIHGLGSYLPAWNLLVEELKSDYRCIRLDLPGYGLSKGGDYAYDMSFFAQVVSAFAKAKKLENIVLVGHSMGGQIALTTAIQNLMEVKQIVLFAPAGIETFTTQEKQWFQQFYTPMVVKMATDEQIEKNFGLNFYGLQLPDNARFMYEDRLKLKGKPEAYDAYANMIPKCVMGMLNEEVFGQLSGLTQAVLVMYGANDALIPNQLLHKGMTTEEIAVKVAEQIPNVKVELLEECGHFVQWDQAKKSAELIKTFLGTTNK
jgi:pimeloyl-ACP methyl ester carboxylesterase